MGLRESLDDSTINDMNCRPVVTIGKEATVRDAVVKMRGGELGCVVVVDDAGVAVGLFTEVILRHRLNEGSSVLAEPLVDHMVERFAWVLKSDSASTVLDAMDIHNTRFIVILDEERRPIGITGQKTLIEFIADFYPRLVLTEDPTARSLSDQKEGA